MTTSILRCLIILAELLVVGARSSLFGYVRSQTAIMSLLPPSSPALKYRKTLQQRGIHFFAFERDFIVDLQRFYPTDPTELFYIKGLDVSSKGSFVDEIGPLYQGEIRVSPMGSYAFGRFTESDHFIGYLHLGQLEQEEPIFVEPASHTPKGEILIRLYEFKDAIYPSCDHFLFSVTCDAGFDEKSSVLFDENRATGGSVIRETLSNFLLKVDESKDNGMQKINFTLKQDQGKSAFYLGNDFVFKYRNSAAVIRNKRDVSNHNRNMTISSDDFVNGTISGRNSDQLPSNQQDHIGKLLNQIGPKSVSLPIAQSLKETEPQTDFTNTEADDISEINITTTSKSCEIQVEVDYSYLKDRDFQNATVLADIYSMIAFVDKNLRKLDIDGDNEPDDTGIVLKRIFIHTSKKKSPFVYNKPSYVQLSEYLEDIWRWRAKARKVKSCLTVVLASKDILEGAIGYSANAEVCQKKPFPVFLTSRTWKRRPPLATFFLSALAHVSRAFGVDIGVIHDQRCNNTHNVKFFGTFGIYLQMLFANCRLRNMKRFLLTTDCLKNFDAVSHRCGNGVVDDEREACDCGPEPQCEKVDPCCSSCQLKEGSRCSQEHPCCDGSCRLVPKEAGLRCGQDGGDCNPATCDGRSERCPRAKFHQYFMKRCLAAVDTMDVMTCNRGVCNTPRCESSGLKPCRCPVGSGHECHMCCVSRAGSCLPVDGALRPMNASCSNSGSCTRAGNCELPPLLGGTKSGERRPSSASRRVPSGSVLVFCVLRALAALGRAPWMLSG